MSSDPVCESCQRPLSEHGPPPVCYLPSCPAPSLTGTYRAPREKGLGEGQCYCTEDARCHHHARMVPMADTSWPCDPECC